MVLLAGEVEVSSIEQPLDLYLGKLGFGWIETTTERGTEAGTLTNTPGGGDI